MDLDLGAGLVDAFIELSPDAVVAVDREGRILAANALAGAMFGEPPGEMVRRRVEDLLPERFRGVHERHRVAYVAEPHLRRMGTGLDLWARRKDGSEFPVDVSLSTIESGSGTVVLAAVRDMTERRAERAAQAELAAIVESTNDAVVASSVEGLITSWNPGATRLLGYAAGEAVGKPIDMLIPEGLQADLHAQRHRAMSGAYLPSFETVRRRCDGTDVPVEVTLSAVRDKSGRVVGVASVMRDIRDRMRARAEHDSAQRQREQLVLLADRERIAGDLHDLVIQRIFGVEMTLQGAVTYLRDVPEVAGPISSVIDELDATIREIRSTIFRLEHHDAAARGLRARVLSLVDEVRPWLGSDPVVYFDGPIDTQVPDEVANNVLAVVREALSNVARHAHATASRVELCASEDLTVTVTDNGVGMTTPARTSGLHNMALRAERLGGRFDVSEGHEGGTHIVWVVPLRAVELENPDGAA